jgi:MFS superfamily sulfate permease-like transporter
MTAQTNVENVVDTEKAALNKRLETVFWGLFLIMLGGWALVPDETIPKGAWSIGVGLLMLGLNLTRYLNKIRMSGFTTLLGILSLIGGIAEFLGWKSLDGALILIILGAYLILKPWFEEKKLFGKAEQS